MSKYADKLINYINEHPEFIQPVSRKNEMMNNFLLPGITGSVRFQNIIFLGHSGRFRSETCRLCVAGRSDQLYHQDWIRCRRQFQ